MKTYSVHTLGCKVNQYESRQIAQALDQLGLRPASGPQRSDLLIVNTCCVTHIASAKSRQQIRKLQKHQTDFPVIVTGCLPAGQTSELNDLDNIVIVKDKNLLPAIVDQLINETTPTSEKSTLSKPLKQRQIKHKNRKFSNSKLFQEYGESSSASVTLPTLNRFSGHCRAFLKVQDGCDAYCTYCIIPKIRKNVWNKDVKTVLAEAADLVVAGHKEIVLTGIFLGAYGQTTARRKKWNSAQKDALTELVNEVSDIRGLERLRLSSLEPLDVTDRLLEVMTSRSNIMPHLHLPLQAGSANVLRKMARQYTIDDYMRVIEAVKSAFDHPAITTDIIVGYPGETEDDFNTTLDIAKEVGFAKIHVFSFSPRKNTPAEKMAKLFGKISPAEIKRRSAELQQLDAELQENFRQSCRGLKESVLIETAKPPKGRCTRYFMVNLRDHTDANNLQKGHLVSVIL